MNLVDSLLLSLEKEERTEWSLVMLVVVSGVARLQFLPWRQMNCVFHSLVIEAYHWGSPDSLLGWNQVKVSCWLIHTYTHTSSSVVAEGFLLRSMCVCLIDVSLEVEKVISVTLERESHFPSLIIESNHSLMDTEGVSLSISLLFHCVNRESM